jgi:hypothetical protein
MANNVIIPPTGTSGTPNPTVETIDTTGSGGPQRQVVTVGDRAGSGNDIIGPINDTAPASDTASASLNGRLQRVAQRLTSLLGLLPSALTASGGLHIGGKTANPTSVLTRPANTTAYQQDQLVASSTTAGSVVVPSFQATPAAGGGGALRRARLETNATSGMGSVAFQIDLWSAAPTFTNGDGGNYVVATGSASWLGSMTFSGLTQAGDGAYGVAVPDTGSDISFSLTGQNIFWTLNCINAAGFTPISGQTFTLTPEIFQD